MKLFKNTSMEIIQLNQTYLCFELPNVMLRKELENLETSTMNIITAR